MTLPITSLEDYEVIATQNILSSVPTYSIPVTSVDFTTHIIILRQANQHKFYTGLIIKSIAVSSCNLNVTTYLNCVKIECKTHVVCTLITWTFTPDIIVIIYRFNIYISIVYFGNIFVFIIY